MTIRYRKNINCLTTDELHDLREALAQMYLLPASDPNSFAQQASFHGGPPTAYCRHGAPGFFTWHRAELKSFEDALRSVGCHVMLPYWDWSSGPTTGIPAACSNPTYINRAGTTVANPLYAGPRNGGGMTVRSSSINTTSFADLATTVQAAMSETSFSSFQNRINSPHGSVHGRVGGDMGVIQTASYDPIFYLHHANVDRIWAQWQQTHSSVPLPAAEASLELQPFTRPYVLQWQQGSDVVSTDALGYRYRPWCFLLPPLRVWEVSKFRFTPSLRERMTAARLIVKSDRMPDTTMELRVFVNQSDATAGTKTIENPGFAGAIGLFGHSRKAHSHANGRAHNGTSEPAGHQHTPGERFDLEMDIAAALRRTKVNDDDLSIKIVAVDIDGHEVPADLITLEAIELEIEADGAEEHLAHDAHDHEHPSEAVAAQRRTAAIPNGAHIHL